MSRSTRRNTRCFRSFCAPNSFGLKIELLEQRRLLSLTPTLIGIDASAYGASPTASASANFTAINDAIAAASSIANNPTGGVVYLPDGIYDTNGPIDLISGVTLRGESAAGINGDETGAVIDYSGSDTAIELTAQTLTTPHQFANLGIQNLTIESGGYGIDTNPDNPSDANYSVELDVENVAFDTVNTAIQLPVGSGYQGAQDAYFHDIQISLTQMTTAGAAAVVISGDADTIDGLVINGPLPESGFANPSAGGLITAGGTGDLLTNITINPSFDSVTGGVTDFYITGGWLTMRDIYAAPNTAEETNPRYFINGLTPETDISIDNLVLNSYNQAKIEGTIDPTESPVVVIDNLQIPSAETLSECISATGLSAVHVSQVSPFTTSWPSSATSPPTLDADLLPTSGINVMTVVGATVNNVDDSHWETDGDSVASQNSSNLTEIMDTIEDTPGAPHVL